MLQVNELIGFGVANEGLVIDYLQTDNSGVINSTVTLDFNNQNFGSENPGRYLIAIFNVARNLGTPLLSTSIGGVAATTIVQNDDVSMLTIISMAKVATGSSGTVSISFNGPEDASIALSLYRTTGLQSASAFDTDTNDDDVVNMSINVENGGFVIAAATMVSGAISSSGVNEDFEGTLTSVSVSGVVGSAINLAAETGRAISFDGASGNAAGVCASFR